jgi:hypothetical protein
MNVRIGWEIARCLEVDPAVFEFIPLLFRMMTGPPSGPEDFYHRIRWHAQQLLGVLLWRRRSSMMHVISLPTRPS